MNIGHKLAGLSLEGSEASVPADKKMIMDLVVETMGSFEHIDSELRNHILAALIVCSKTVDGHFEELFAVLDRGQAQGAQQKALADEVSPPGAPDAAESLPAAAPPPSAQKTDGSRCEDGSICHVYRGSPNPEEAV